MADKRFHYTTQLTIAFEVVEEEGSPSSLLTEQEDTDELAASLTHEVTQLVSILGAGFVERLAVSANSTRKEV